MQHGLESGTISMKVPGEIDHRDRTVGRDIFLGGHVTFFTLPGSNCAQRQVSVGVERVAIGA